MKKLTLLLTALFVIGYVLPSLAQFETSLHKTREGKRTWYDTENGGYETLTGEPIEGLPCLGCHPKDGLDANGDPVVVPFVANCVDCHATNTPPAPGPVTEADCLGCHGRAGKIRALGVSDVHRDAATPLVCWDCHGSTEMHGDGTPYTSMLEPGAVVTDCEQAGCHAGHTHINPGNDPHGGALHCSSCHMQTNLTCYSCHFDSQVAGVKRAYKAITGFVILMNRAKDGKVHPATFQSLYHDASGGSWIAMAPNYTHSITKTGARGCSDCHQNFGGSIPAIEEYNAGNGIKFATWNSSDSTLSYKPGIVPLPVDYLYSFKKDFITYNGNVTDPAGPSKNWSYVKDEADGWQLLYGSPLSAVQMAKLGMDTLQIIPVELTSFAASVRGDAVTLNWSTATETNNQGFEVYRAFGESKYELIGFVDGSGTTPETRSYSFIDSKLTSGIYLYKLKQIDFDGTFEYSYEIMVEVLSPDLFALMQNYPNPFNPTTTIKFSIPVKSVVELNVYNQVGELVQTLVNEELTAGTHDVEFNGENLSSGIYFYQIKAKDFVSTKKLVLLK